MSLASDFEAALEDWRIYAEGHARAESVADLHWAQTYLAYGQQGDKKPPEAERKAYADMNTVPLREEAECAKILAAVAWQKMRFIARTAGADEPVEDR